MTPQILLLYFSTLRVVSITGFRQFSCSSQCGTVIHSKQGSPLSMYVEVPFEFMDRVMSRAFWSKNIRVSGWLFRYNYRRRNRNDHADFCWEMDY